MSSGEHGLPLHTQRDRSFGERVLIILSRWRIEVAFILGAIALVAARPTPSLIAACLPLTVLALGIRLWARGHLTRRGHLTQSGPYAFVRHPLYVGSFLLGLSFVGMAGVPILLILFSVLFVLMYFPKALREEEFLRERYGDEYVGYERRVGRFVPRTLRFSQVLQPPQRFSWRLVFRHREQRAWVGSGLALFALSTRAVGWQQSLLAYIAEQLPVAWLR